MAMNDFEFHLGKDRQLKGRGWVGIVALALLLVAVVAISAAVPRAVLGGLEAAISQLSSETKKLF